MKPAPVGIEFVEFHKPIKVGNDDLRSWSSTNDRTRNIKCAEKGQFLLFWHIKAPERVTRVHFTNVSELREIVEVKA